MRPCVVVVGAGFAGFHTARRLRRLLKDAAEVVVISNTNYFLYVPLLPQTAGGVLDPRRLAVPLNQRLPGVRSIPGEVDTIDFDQRRVDYRTSGGGQGSVEYDRLVIAVGSVHKLLPIPGVAEHAHGFRGIPEALYLRDHLIRQVELASLVDSPAERAACNTFVVVGAGYTGTEVTAHGQLLTQKLARWLPPLASTPPRWLLVDIAPRVLPELDERLSRTASRVLRRRGVELYLETSVEKATADGVQLSTGEHIPTRTLVWCVGCGRTRWWRASDSPRGRAGWWSMSGSRCPTTRRCTPAATPPRWGCRTSPARWRR